MNKDKSNIKIGYISVKNPRDRKSWSGTHYRMLTALEKEFENIYIIGPYKLHFILSFFLKLKNIAHKIAYGKKYDRGHSMIRSKYYAKVISKKLKKHQLDVLFAPAGSTSMACLKTDIPMIYLSDTTYSQISNYYDTFSNISQKSIDESNQVEQMALDNSACQIFSSNWALDHAKSFYNAKNGKVIKFGANVDSPPDITKIKKDYSGKIQILFLGVKWNRKGGDIVLETIDILSKKNTNFHLTVCGCVPPKEHPNMTVIPFLNKNIPEERDQLNKLLYESHILFVPTRADCTPIVFCEAAAYGIPIISTDTGGVSATVKNGVNGYLLPLEADANSYAATIQKLLDNYDQIRELSKGSRELYDQELNWNTWGSEMKKVITNLTSKTFLT